MSFLLPIDPDFFMSNLRPEPVVALLLAGWLVCDRGVSAEEPALQPNSTTKRIYKVVGDRPLRITIRTPKDWTTDDRRNAVVFFHGGGWVGGKPGQFDHHAAHLNQHGFVSFQVEYRLLDRKSKTPPITCIADAKSAMRYVRGHATTFGIDPERIASGGGSAGGHLSAFVGMVDGLDDPNDDLTISAKSNAMLLFNPVYDNGPKGWGTARVGDRYREISPFHNVSADDPPAVVFLGSRDKLIPVETAREFERRMRKVGVTCITHIFEGEPHGFFNYGRNGNKAYLKTIEQMDAFLRRIGWLTADGSES